MTATKKKPKKRAKKSVLSPATGDPREAPHVSRAEAGCRCVQCGMHRLEERRAERDRRQIAAAEDAMIGEATWFEHQPRGAGR